MTSELCLLFKFVQPVFYSLEFCVLRSLCRLHRNPGRDTRRQVFSSLLGKKFV